MRPSDSLWADSPLAQKKKKQADKEQDEQDDRDDKELLDILKTTKLVNNVTSSDLSGKDRRAFLQNRMVELGAKTAFKPAKVSLPMHLGMKKKASERVEKKIQQAKDFGTYVPSLKKDLVRGEIALTRGKRPAGSDHGKRILDKGIIGSVGRLRHGVMKVSKKIIESVESRGGGGGGKGKKRSSNGGMRLSY